MSIYSSGVNSPSVRMPERKPLHKIPMNSLTLGAKVSLKTTIKRIKKTRSVNARIIPANTRSIRRSTLRTIATEHNEVASVNRNGTISQFPEPKTANAITKENNTAELCPYRIVIIIAKRLAGIIIQSAYGVEQIGSLLPNEAAKKRSKRNITCKSGS